MRYHRYLILADEKRHTYEFYSEGLQGRIKKSVIYTRIKGNLFNLGFQSGINYDAFLIRRK